MNQLDLAGYAVYGEYQRGDNTVQLLLTPEGLTETYAHVPAMIYRRTISTSSRRATWNTTTLEKFGTFNVTSGVIELAQKYSSIQPTSLPAEVGVPALATSRTLKQLGVYNYKLNKRLIVVEVSVADMTDLRAARTPYKILNRVTKSRKALGFAESLFASESAA